MIKILKRISAAIAAGLVMLTFSAMPVAAHADTSSDYDRVFDYDGILTDDQIDKLEKMLDDVSEKTKMNAAVIIDSSVEGSEYEWQDYADCEFDYEFGVNTDGTLLYIRFDPNYVHFSTSGEGNDLYSDTDWYNDILDDVAPQLTNGNTYQAVVKYCDGLEYYYNLNQNMWIVFGGIGLIIGVVIALIVIGVVYYRYHRNLPEPSTSYVKGNDVVYKERTDNFIRTYTTKSKIESESGGGGGGTHTSSSGGSHGGGGRSF